MGSGRPQAGEYGAHAEADIAKVNGDDAVDALANQTDEVNGLIASLDEDSTAGLRYAPDKWTLKEVFGHMIDDERIFAYRMLCIARGDQAPLISFDEKRYVEGANFEQRTLDSLISEYTLVRGATIALLESLPQEAWMRRGSVAGYSATVRGLAFHIAGHELHHLAIIRERYLRTQN